MTSGAPRGRSIAMSSIHHRDTCTNLVFSPASKTFVTSQANSGVFVLRDCLRSAARVGAPAVSSQTGSGGDERCFVLIFRFKSHLQPRC